jgi:soluble lytic murein transglycosylase-like protein
MNPLRIVLGALALVIAVATTVACSPDERALWERWSHAEPIAAQQELAKRTPAEISSDAPLLTPDQFAGLAAHVAEVEQLTGCARYDRWIDQAGLPAHFHAVMRRESTCVPTAHNRSGASGLLQLMPGWIGSCVAALGAAWAGLFDALSNILCAAKVVYPRQGGGAWSTW